MKVGIISDSHDNVPAVKLAVALFNRRGVDAVVHAGDFVAPFAVKPLLDLDAPLTAVFGNNDGEKAGIRCLIPQIAEPPLRTELGGCRVIVSHSPLSAGKAGDADIVISGHTHKPLTETLSDTLFINPGECGGWLTGRRTVTILDTDTLDVELIDLNGN